MKTAVFSPASAQALCRAGRPVVTAAALLALLTLVGCIEPMPSSTPRGRTRFVDSAYQIPVAVPVFNGRIDRNHARVAQSVIVRSGQPATFRINADVQRPEEGAELRVFARGAQIFTLPAATMRPGDPPLPVVVALPVPEQGELVDVRLELYPPSSRAVFEVTGASVTIGEVPPAAVNVGEMR